MSFERAHNATSRADQTTVRRANLGVVLQQIAGGEPRSRARVAAETGLTRGTVFESRRRVDRPGPPAGDRRGRALRPGRPTGSHARAGRSHRLDRARGQRRLSRRLRRGLDGSRALRTPLYEDNRRSSPAPCSTAWGRRRGRHLKRSTRRACSRPAPASHFRASSKQAHGMLLRAPNLGLVGGSGRRRARGANRKSACARRERIEPRGGR